MRLINVGCREYCTPPGPTGCVYPENVFSAGHQFAGKEPTMDVNSYCDSLDKQLGGWKATIYDVIRIVDKLPARDKESIYPSLRGLHAVVDQINTELENLRTACPADWSPNRKNIEEKMTELQLTLKKLSEKINGPLIPDSLAWVSE
jgi:hypothetical protein